MTSHSTFEHPPHRLDLLHSWYGMTVRDFLFPVDHENETLNVVSAFSSSYQINVDWVEEALSVQ